MNDTALYPATGPATGSATGQSQARATAAAPTAAPASAVDQDRLALILKVYLITVVLPIGFFAGPIYLTLLRLVVLVTVVPLFFMLMSGRYGRLILPDFLFLAHVVWQAIALIANNHNGVLQAIGSSGMEFYGGYLIGRVYIRTPGQFVNLAKWLVGIVIITIPFALYEARTGQPLLIELIQAAPLLVTEANINNDPRLGMERAQVVFAHPIHYGLYASIAFAMGFIALKYEISTKMRYFLSGTVGMGVFLSLSSGALLAVLIQLFLLMWAMVFYRVKARWWLLLGFCALLYIGIDLLSERTPVRVFMSYATFSAHNAFWRGLIFEHGMLNVWANPIFGIGLGDWVRPEFMRSSSIDNHWLTLAVSYGFPGFFSLTVPFFWMLWCVVRRDLGPDERLNQLRLAWMICFMGLSFTLATVAIWKVILSFVFFMFGAGMWIVTTDVASRKSDGAAEEDTSPPTPPAPTTGYSRFPIKRSRTHDPASSAVAAPTRPQRTYARRSPRP